MAIGSNPWLQLLAGFALVPMVLFIPARASSQDLSGQRENTRPNILLIVADDLGFTDIGAFGGEIRTPNIDALASAGLRLTDFHVGATCSPTRAMLLTGTDHHLAGLGTMIEHRAPNQVGHPGYEGYLNSRVVSVATLLRDAGYHTYMAGKWHLGMKPGQTPDARGFEQSFVLLQGGASHFSDARGLVPKVPYGLYRENGRPVEKLPDDFYSSAFYADRIIQNIEGDRRDNKPFFAYLAFTAPHWPLQARAEDIDRYRGKYDEGYAVLRERRLQKARQLGVVSGSAEFVSAMDASATWAGLSDEERKIEARKMEIYAAMVDSMDQHLGRVLQYLKDSGEYDDTLILFMSDNGAEGADRRKLPGVADWLESSFDQSYENMGRKNSYVYYGSGWAEASMGPFKMYKSFLSEGGIRSPAIVSYPRTSRGGRVNHSFASVLDIAPTLLEVAGVAHPGLHYQGKDVLPLSGKSMVGLINGTVQSVHDKDHVMGWELFDHRAVRKGPWKLLRLSSAPDWLVEPPNADHWALYNLSDDPGETNDLSGERPELVEQLLDHWQDYAAQNDIILPEWDKGRAGH